MTDDERTLLLVLAKVIVRMGGGPDDEHMKVLVELMERVHKPERKADDAPAE